MLNKNMAKSGVIVVLLLVALAGFDSLNSYSYNKITGAAVSSTDLTNVEIKPGWNIIGINTIQNLISTTCDRNRISDTVWAYYPQANDYGRYKLNADFKGIESAGDEKSDSYRNSYPDTLTGTRAIWLHNNGEACTLTAAQTNPTAGFTIPAGWNMLAVQTNWQGKKFSDVLGTCTLPDNLAEAGIAGLFYELPKGWEIISPDTAFRHEKVGKGFWTTVGTACVFQEATETASLLKSDFFKADETAESIVNGGNYELKTANYITSNGLNTLTFEYKILNALMQLGYNRLAFTLSGQSITANLNEFQKKNGLPITDFVDKETMLALDYELSEREKLDREIADRYPPFAHFIEAPLNEPPKAHLAALYAGFYAAIPRFGHIRLRGWTTDEFRSALLNHGASPGRMLNPEGTRVLTFDEMAEVAVKKLDFKFCGSGAYYHKFRDYSKNPDDDVACLKPIDTIRSFNSASSDLHYMELFAHEFGHLVGGQQQITLDNGRTDRADFLFGEISFYKSNGKWFWVRQSGPRSEFVSEYARVSVSNELDPKSYDSSYYIPAEDFAESFFAYIFVGDIFRERAKSDVYLRQKYDFLKKYIFQAVEYDTGYVKSLQLWESKNSGIPFHPDYYLLFDPDFTWNYNYDKLKN